MERDQLNEYDRALYDAFMSLAVRKSIRVIMGEIETSAIDQSCPLLRERRKSGHPLRSAWGHTRPLVRQADKNR